MGLLDEKSRIQDVIVTIEGRRHLVKTGGFHPAYVSFTDQTFYESDAASGSLDIHRAMVEATSLPFDAISSVTSSIDPSLINDPGAFFRSIEKLDIIGTAESIDEDEQFSVSPTDLTFNILPKNVATRVVTLERAKSLFEHFRALHTDNFRFLPPVQVVRDETVELGRYSNRQDVPVLTWDDMERRLKRNERKDIEFVERSNDNNFLCQVFEVDSAGNLTRLEVIDFGEFVTGEGNRRVFFIGKLNDDQDGLHVFSNIFTVVFE